MTTLRRLLPVAVLSLSACLVSTDDLKPRTDADCFAQDPDTKACGYKCVRIDDPVTGCGGSDCVPCNASPLPHVVPACDDTHSCTLVCAPAWHSCDGILLNGCEAFLPGDPANCGACGRACPPGGACTEGICAPLAQLDVYPSVPRGMLSHLGTVYFVQDDGYPEYQAFCALDGIPIINKLGRVRWLAGEPLKPRVWATGTMSYANTFGFKLALTAIDLSTVPPSALIYEQFDPLSSSEYLDGIAVTGAGRVLFTSSQDWDLFVFDPLAASTPPIRIDLAAASGMPRGIARYVNALGQYYLFGYSDGGGTLSFVQETTPGGLSPEQIALTGAGTPSRLAVWQSPSVDGTGNMVFWASEDDGGVRWADLGDWARRGVAGWPTGPTTLMDITADADGVYWTNRSTGLVTMWKAATGEVIPLSWSRSPFGIATSGTRVYWTDDVDQKVYYTTKY